MQVNLKFIHSYGNRRDLSYNEIYKLLPFGICQSIICLHFVQTVFTITQFDYKQRQNTQLNETAS